MAATPDPLAVPRRVAFAGDWHANVRWAGKTIRYAADERADVIVHCGDFGYRFDEQFLLRLTADLTLTGLTLLFVEGNHDDHDWLRRRRPGPNGLRRLTSRIWHAPRGYRWTWDRVRFLALGGAHSVDRPWRTAGLSWWPGETITTRQANLAIRSGPADVLVAHDCPAGVTIPGIDDRTGPDPFPAVELAASQQHRELLRHVVDHVQPTAVFHGHYHRAYTATADLGYGPVAVRGLDCDETTLDGNVRVVDLADLPAGAR